MQGEESMFRGGGSVQGEESMLRAGAVNTQTKSVNRVIAAKCGLCFMLVCMLSK